MSAGAAAYMLKSNFKCGKDLAYAVVYNKLGRFVRARGGLVYDHKVLAAEKIYKARRGIHNKRGAAYYKRIRLRNSFYGGGYNIAVKALLIQHNVRLYCAAAAALRHTRGAFYVVHTIKLAAARAIVAQNAAVKLQNVFTARRLMQAVYVLGYYRFQLARRLQPRKIYMRGIGLRPEIEHFVAVKFKKFLCTVGEKGVRHYLLGRVGVFLGIQPVLRAEVGYAALGAHPRPAEKYYALALVYYLL